MTEQARLLAIDHVQLAMPSGGEDRARAFYVSVLGLAEVPKPAALATRGGAWFEGEAVRVHLGVEADFRPARKAHPAFAVSDLQALRRALESAGCAVREGETLESGARLFADDPFGNRLEFLEPRPLALAPDRFEDGRPMMLAGLRRRHDFADAERGIAEQWRALAAGPVPPGLRGAERYGVVCGADATGIEYMCGAEVATFDGLPEGAGRMRVPAQRYAVFAPRAGDRQTLRERWAAILEWLEGGAWVSAHRPDFELYAPGVDPLAPEGRVEIWVGVLPRSKAGRNG